MNVQESNRCEAFGRHVDRILAFKRPNVLNDRSAEAVVIGSVARIVSSL